MEEVLAIVIALTFVFSYFASIIMAISYSDKYWSWMTYQWVTPKLSQLYFFIGSATWFVLLTVIIIYIGWYSK